VRGVLSLLRIAEVSEGNVINGPAVGVVQLGKLDRFQLEPRLDRPILFNK